jgi:hypothetical protein
MTENQIHFIRGSCTTILLFAVGSLLAAIFLLPDKSNDELKNKSKFEVLDQYEGCSVIRYTDPTTRWHYFLKCS